MVAYGAGNLVCGELNAKNAYGGYVGFEPFAASPRNAMFFAEDDLDELKEEYEAAANAGLVAACGQ